MRPRRPASDALLRRWGEVDALFDEALSIPPDERPDFLDQRCGSDDGLRALLEELLQRAGETEDLLARPPGAGPFRESDDLLLGSLQGLRLGAFQLEELVGQGGLGVVYAARRVTGGFSQRVAIKLLLDARGDEVIRRFEREREILASLSHPGIATLLDGGTAPDGRPYLVMEFVEGMPIHDYCMEAELTPRERLKLFLRVCEAVDFAHSRLVIHGDLKPSNILVTEGGDPKLLDFGIAKLLEPGDMDPTGSGDALELTATGFRALTPACASPEQIKGEPVAVRSDVFQLGTLLYELLTGRRPNADAGTTPAALVTAICETEPPPPSQVVTGLGATGLSARVATLRGDLDAIVLKALQKEPMHRYGSVPALSEDIRRYLDGMPVRARAPSLRYRAGKFTRRNRLAVAVIALLLAGVVAGFAGLVAHSARLEVERDRAQFEAQRADAVTAFLIDLFDQAEQSGARDTLTVAALLKAGEERLEARTGDHPLIHIEILGALANAYRHSGIGLDYQRIDARRAAAVRAHYGPDDLRTAEAYIDLGAARARDHIWTDAGQALDEGLAILRRLPPEAAERAEARTILSRALYHLSAAYRELGRPDDAMEVVQEYLGLEGTLTDDGTARDLATELGALAFVLRGQERHREAAELYETALALEQAREGPIPPSLLNNYASLLRTMDRVEEAEQHFREAIALVLPAPGEDVSTHVDILHMNLRDLLTAVGHHDAAVETALNLQSMIEATHPPDHWRMGRATSQVGVAYHGAGDCTNGARFLGEAVDIYTAGLGRDHPWTASTQTFLAACLSELGQVDRAEAVLLEAHASLRAASGDERNRLVHNAQELVRLYRTMDRGEAAARYRRLLAELEADNRL